MTENLEMGIGLFNGRKFFEAHEEWEKLWRKMDVSSERYFIQGLIMIAGAFVHYQRGNYAGMSKLIEKGRPLLNIASGRLLGIDSEGLLRQVSLLQEKLLKSGAEISEADFPRIKKIDG